MYSSRFACGYMPLFKATNHIETTILFYRVTLNSIGHLSPVEIAGQPSVMHYEMPASRNCDHYGTLIHILLVHVSLTLLDKKSSKRKNGNSKNLPCTEYHTRVNSEIHLVHYTKNTLEEFFVQVIGYTRFIWKICYSNASTTVTFSTWKLWAFTESASFQIFLQPNGLVPRHQTSLVKSIG